MYALESGSYVVQDEYALVKVQKPVKILVIMFSRYFALSGCQDKVKKQQVNNPMQEEQTNLKVATLAGGCFWCLAADFENVSGVTKVISGYTVVRRKTHLRGSLNGKDGAPRSLTGVLRSFKGEL